MEKGVTLDIQNKPDTVLIIKSQIQTINQESDVNIFLILDLQKKHVKVLKNFRRRLKEKM